MRRVPGAYMMSAFVLFLLLWMPSKSTGGQQPDVQLLVSQKQYRSGETVRFTLTNTGAADIVLPSPAPWVIMRGNKVVYQPSTSGELVPLPARQALTWTVSQTPSEFGSIEKPGLYEIHLRYYDSQFGQKNVTCRFIIAGS